MKTLTLTIELTYDDVLMHSDDPGEEEWFRNDVLGGQLVLHSNEIGDEVGTVRVIAAAKEDGEP